MAGRHRKPPPGPGRHRKESQPGRWASPVLAGLIVLGIGGVGAATALTSDHGQPGQSPTPVTRTTTPAPTAATPSSPAASTPSPTPSRTTARRAAKPAAFTITVTGHVSWVEVSVPGRRVLYSGLLRHGKTLRYRTGPLAVTIGDAGAVRTVVHGRVHSPAGARGAVLRFTVR